MGVVIQTVFIVMRLAPWAWQSTHICALTRKLTESRKPALVFAFDLAFDLADSSSIAIYVAQRSYQA